MPRVPSGASQSRSPGHPAGSDEFLASIALKPLGRGEMVLIAWNKNGKPSAGVNEDHGFFLPFRLPYKTES